MKALGYLIVLALVGSIVVTTGAPIGAAVHELFSGVAATMDAANKIQVRK